MVSLFDSTNIGDIILQNRIVMDPCLMFVDIHVLTDKLKVKELKIYVLLSNLRRPRSSK